jgi:hypothetical protein
MSKFDHDFDWQRALLPEVKRACATHLICEAPPEEDMKHNTDLIVLKMDTVRIAVRLRRNSYLTQRNYANEFTIRSTRPKSGADTELTKVVSGWGDYNFYGFATADGKGLAAWVLGDLKVFRRWFNHRIVKDGGKIPGQSKPNSDGSSEFYAFTIDELPPEFVIARVMADKGLIADTAVDISTSAEMVTDADMWDEYAAWISDQEEEVFG